MALKTFKPITPSLRGTVLIDRSGLYKGRSLRSKLTKIPRSYGKNNRGIITVRHKQSGSKRLYRIVDFVRENHGIPGTVERLEYDPNRSAFIALIKYVNGDKRYIVAPDGLNVGDAVMSGPNAPVAIGNRLPLENIPQGVYVHAISFYPNTRAKVALAAGTSAYVMGSRDGYTQLKMPSGEIRLFKSTSYATIGIVSNVDHKNEKLGKAGRSRRRGVRPTVRGVAMSYKHPHGAGQGKSGRHGTGRVKQDVYGNVVGVRTRKRRNITNKFIVKRRTEKNKFKSFKTIV